MFDIHARIRPATTLANVAAGLHGPWIMAAAAVLLAFAFVPAMAATEHDMKERYCAPDGMITEFTFPDTTRADCISKTHAIEVEFTEKWAEALAQALHYALWTNEIAEAPNDFPRWSRQIDTPRKAGIILVCRKAQDTCTGHYVRLFRIIEEFRLPVTIWNCDVNDDPILADCQVIDMPD